MAALASIAFILFAAGGALLVAAFLLWHPISADIQKRVDALERTMRVRARETHGDHAAQRTKIDAFRWVFMLGMSRKWGVSASPLTLFLLGCVTGGVAWLLCRQMLTLPHWAAIPVSALAFWLAPNLLARMEQAGQDKRFTDLFPDAIDMIVRVLRAGLPVSVAIRTVAQEAPTPINRVFTALADQLDIGIAFEDALGIGSERIGLPDFRFFAAAVALQHSTGGNLIATLEILRDIIRRRRALRMKAKAATAEVRMSAYVLSSLPFVIVGAVLTFDPSYMIPLIVDPRGNTILSIAFTMLVLAFLTMRYMMRSAVRM